MTAEFYKQQPLPQKTSQPKNVSDKGKIRVCYVSPNFCRHVVYDYYCALLRDYDRERFHVICVSLGSVRDSCTEKIKGWVDEFIDGADMSFHWLAGEIRKCQVDILVDLAGHSGGSGLPLLGYRLAPVQIFGLGWMETTGCSYVDFLLTDQYLDPRDASYRKDLSSVAFPLIG